ncbi:MAG: hypothetical protein ABI999_12785 [Acidobacteriota bacterium]
MPDSTKDLGKLIGSHGIAPVFIQRAVVISIISFLFFLAMMLGFYLRQNLGYFLLATAFLLVYLITMFSWMMQRKTELRIFENGLSFKKKSIRWTEIKQVGDDGVLDANDGTKMTFPRSLRDFDAVINTIRARAGTEG